jgi:hypothetical protein
MKPVVKVLLGGCAALVLLVIAVAGGSVWWVSAHRDDLVAKGRELRAGGEEAGRTLDQNGCIDSALARYGRDRGIITAVHARVWLGGCLATASPTEGLCASVPSRSEIARTAMWRVSQCEARGFGGDPRCPNILTEVQEHCARR